MTATKSRASSTRPPSVARSIQRKRDKPYKTEQSRVMARKRKLNLTTSYTKAPRGFQFLPVGTPDLAERCKELSRQRALTVNVVNAKPLSKAAQNPDKVSHHIHRIGYHFREDVVDDACQELGYTYDRGRFVKESDLAQENEKSRMARAMSKWGIHLNEPARQETDEQIRAAIKELFPKMPDEDLQNILSHAWKAGSQRIGTNSMIELPRRVQLATIARIRHTYTDYDNCLRAFDWKKARALVEPVCLQKLIEWRGETEEEDDDELEEIVRETIVIDDDDDEPVRDGSEADDEDSAADVDQGYASDTSLEITHKPVALDDLAAESHDERSRRFLTRHQPQTRDMRYLDVRQMIGAARQSLRNPSAAIADPADPANPANPANPAAPAEPNVVQVHVPERHNGDDVIVVDGKLFLREPLSGGTPRPPTQYLYVPPPPPATPLVHQVYVPGPAPRSCIQQQPFPRHANPAEEHAGHYDRPIPSIEPQGDLRRQVLSSASVAQPGYRPEPLDGDSPGKRRRLEYVGTSTHHGDQRDFSNVSTTQYHKIPEQHKRPSSDAEQPFQANPSHSHAGWHRQPMGYNSLPCNATPAENPHGAQHMHGTRVVSAQFAPGHYNSGRVIHYQPESRQDAQVAPIQYLPLPQRTMEQVAPDPRYRADGHGHHLSGYPQHHAQDPPRVVYVEAPRAGYMPQPMHGAPAPVQQIPRDVPGTRSWLPVASTASYHPSAAPLPPLPAAPPAHPQYYHPR